MAAISPFFTMTTQQQQIEKIWYNILKELAHCQDPTVIVISKAVKTNIGDAGMEALAQRCRAFNNSHIEVKDSPITADTLFIVTGLGSLGDTGVVGETSPAALTVSDKKISRPPNSFILYRQHHHPDLVAKNPGVHNNQISQIIGKMWKSEPQTVRDDWKRKADEAKAKHLKDHPDYQYQPRKPSEKKRRMTKRKAEVLAGEAAVQQSLPDTFGDIINMDGFNTPKTIFNTGDGTEMPNFESHSNQPAASFIFDPEHDEQIELFNEMMLNHNTLSATPYHPNALNAAAAAISVPTLAHNDQYNYGLNVDDVASAEASLFHAELSLEAQLSMALEQMERERKKAEPLNEYNDVEAQRFTDFLDQMPEHMWGMEFVDYP